MSTITIHADENHVNARSKLAAALNATECMHSEGNTFIYASEDEAKAAINVAHNYLRATCFNDESIDFGETFVEYDGCTASID